MRHAGSGRSLGAKVKTDRETKRPPEKPEWYYRLSPEAKADYDAWVAEGCPSFLDEDESIVMPGRP